MSHGNVLRICSSSKKSSFCSSDAKTPKLKSDTPNPWKSIPKPDIQPINNHMDNDSDININHKFKFNSKLPSSILDLQYQYSNDNDLVSITSYFNDKYGIVIDTTCNYILDMILEYSYDPMDNKSRFTDDFWKDSDIDFDPHTLKDYESDDE